MQIHVASERSHYIALFTPHFKTKIEEWNSFNNTCVERRTNERKKEKEKKKESILQNGLLCHLSDGMNDSFVCVRKREKVRRKEVETR